jgi:tetraacyldisaccharide 4'-kinase
VRTVHYFDVISKRDRNWTADLARFALAVASIPYGLATELRNSAYHTGLLKVRGVTAPVISVGNITTGGTGKTPTVAWLVNWLRSAELRPAIISRGYRSLLGMENDEKLLLDNLCAGVPHLQQPDRRQSAERVLREFQSNVIVLDDGFQHRRLHRDLDIVLIDALNPWGYGWLLPRGLLRERPCHLRRADVVLITRCELASDEQIRKLKQELCRLTPAPVLRTAFRPRHFVNWSGERLSLAGGAEKRAFAFCGIGNPEAFRRTLTSLAATVPDDRLMIFPDHHHYRLGDFHRIGGRATGMQAEILLTTQKDLVKVQRDQIQNLPVWALEIGLTFLDDPGPIWRLLRTVLPPAATELPEPAFEFEIDSPQAVSTAEQTTGKHPSA